MSKVLVAYGSKYGSTGEVAEAVAKAIAEEGHDVEVSPAAEVGSVTGYDLVVLGGGLYMGRWHGDAKTFLQRHGEELQERRLAVFAMGPDSLAEAKVAESRKQLDAALARLPQLEPFAVAIFGGVTDPAKLRFPLNKVIPAGDARDWDAIAAWARELAAVVPSAVA